MVRLHSLITRGLGFALAALLVSCSTADLPTSESASHVQGAPAEILGELLNPKTGVLGTGLLACQARPYASASQVIGPEGGTLRVGRHVLQIPAGALATPTRITAEAPSDPVASVRLSPEGLHFAAGRKARLTLDYSNCPLGALQLLKRVAYTTERLNILSYLLSQDNILLRRISTNLEHFSRYAVAW